MNYWARVRTAVLRGLVYSMLGALIAAGANAEFHGVPEPWGMFAFIGVTGAGARLWPIVPNGAWWEEAWGSGVVWVSLVVAGILLGAPVLAGAGGAGALLSANYFYNKRRDIVLRAL